MKRNKVSRIRRAVESLECRRLMSGNYFDTGVGTQATFAYPGAAISLHHRVIAQDQVANTNAPTTLGVSYSLSADGIAGNAHDIALGSWTVSLWAEGDQYWYAMVGPDVTLPSSLSAGTYRLVATTALTGATLGQQLEVISPSDAPAVVLGDGSTHHHSHAPAENPSLGAWFQGTVDVGNRTGTDIVVKGKAYLSTDDVLDGSDVELEQVKMWEDFEQTIPAGKEHGRLIMAHLTTGAVGETYHIIYVVDGVNAPLPSGPVVWASPSFTIAPSPDVVGVSVSGPTSVLAGTGFGVNGQLEGPLFSAVLSAAIYLSSDEVAGNDDDILVGNIYSTGPGGFLSGTVSLDGLDVAPGEYRLVLRADGQDSIIEADELNNYVLGGTVTVRPFTAPELVWAVGGELKPSMGLAFELGGRFHVYIGYLESIATETKSVRIRAHLSSDGVLSGEDEELKLYSGVAGSGSGLVIEFVPGRHLSGPLFGEFTAGTAGETYRVIFTADYVDSPMANGPLTWVSQSFVMGSGDVVDGPASEPPVEAPGGDPVETPGETPVDQPVDLPELISPGVGLPLPWTPIDFYPDTVVPPAEVWPTTELAAAMQGVLATETVSSVTLKRGRVKFAVKVTNTGEEKIKGPTTFSVAVVRPETGELSGDAFVLKRRLNLDGGESKVVSYSRRLSGESAEVLAVSKQMAITTEAATGGEMATDELFCGVEVLG